MLFLLITINCMTITQEDLKKLLHYDPDTGVFTWIVDRNPGIKKGQRAGYVCSDGRGKKYISIGIKGKYYKSHRLVWLYVNGFFPSDQIDHIDGNGCNNSLKNLREVSNRENCRNRKIYSFNKSGYTGVSWYTPRNKWIARINNNKRTIHLGYFDNINDAISARKSAERELSYHENHGKKIVNL